MEADPPPSPRSARLERLWPWALAVLVLVTSTAVASVSIWLMIPYLLVMAWMVFGPSGGDRRDGELPVVAPAGKDPTREEPRPSFWSRLRQRRAVVAAEDEPAAEEPAEPAPTPATGTEEGETVGDSPRPKRSRSRKRPKAAKPTAEPSPSAPVEVVWVRVGPNQFVRKEVPVEATPETDTGSDNSPTDEVAETDPPAPREESAAEPLDDGGASESEAEDEMEAYD